MFKSKAAILISMLGVSGITSADAVTPISYTATLGEGQDVGGSYNYFDETGTQLIDGANGDNDFSADLGNGNAYEWIGWLTTDPVLNFTFESAVTISQVQIGFNRCEACGVHLPNKVTINDKPFTLKGSEIADVKRGYLKFNGPFVGPILNILLEDGDSNRWIFVDEIRFTTLLIEGTAQWGTAHTVTCQNVTRNKTVVIPKTKASAWNCEKAGLAVKSGEKVKVTIEGTKY